MTVGVGIGLGYITGMKQTCQLSTRGAGAGAHAWAKDYGREWKETSPLHSGWRFTTKTILRRIATGYCHIDVTDADKPLIDAAPLTYEKPSQRA